MSTVAPGAELTGN